MSELRQQQQSIKIEAMSTKIWYERVIRSSEASKECLKKMNKTRTMEAEQIVKNRTMKVKRETLNENK
jgi:hypothetical protein